MHAVKPWRSNDLSLLFFEVPLSLFLCGVCVCARMHVCVKERKRNRDGEIVVLSLFLGHIMNIYSLNLYWQSKLVAKGSFTDEGWEIYSSLGISITM